MSAPLLTLHEAARRCHVSVRTLEREHDEPARPWGVVAPVLFQRFLRGRVPRSIAGSQNHRHCRRPLVVLFRAAGRHVYESVRNASGKNLEPHVAPNNRQQNRLVFW